MLYRQGDILLRPAKKEEGMKLVGKFSSYVLAVGEATGHKHLLVAEPKTEFEIYQDKEGRFYLNLLGEGKLTHEEHKPLTILPDFYVVEKEREYNYFEQATRRVID